MRSRLERMEHTFHESKVNIQRTFNMYSSKKHFLKLNEIKLKKRMSDSKELTYRNRIEQLETELGFEKKKREAAEREVEIAKQQSHQKLPSSKTLDGLLQDLEKRIRDGKNEKKKKKEKKNKKKNLGFQF